MKNNIGLKYSLAESCIKQQRENFYIKVSYIIYNNHSFIHLHSHFDYKF